MCLGYLSYLTEYRYGPWVSDKKNTCIPRFKNYSCCLAIKVNTPEEMQWDTNLWLRPLLCSLLTTIVTIFSQFIILTFCSRYYLANLLVVWYYFKPLLCWRVNGNSSVRRIVRLKDKWSIAMLSMDTFPYARIREQGVTNLSQLIVRIQHMMQVSTMRNSGKCFCTWKPLNC